MDYKVFILVLSLELQQITEIEISRKTLQYLAILLQKNINYLMVKKIHYFSQRILQYITDNHLKIENINSIAEIPKIIKNWAQ